jgi:nicotinate phosphoribosyltransferase
MLQSSIPSIYNQSLMLLTDFYQITMSYGYWKAGLDQKEAVFHLFFRKTPFKGGFTVAAGLESVIHFLKNFKFDPSDLDYLAKLEGPDGNPYFNEELQAILMPFLKGLSFFLMSLLYVFKGP